MSLGEGIAIASLILTVLTALITLSVKVGTYAEKQKDQDEKNEKYDKKFDELFCDRNKHAEIIIRLDTTISGINSTLNKMDSKLDKLAEAVNESHQAK